MRRVARRVTLLSRRSGTRACGRYTSGTTTHGCLQARCHDFAGILFRLQETKQPADAAAPGFRLHPLNGNRAGQWSVRVTGNWRVVFRFEDNEAVDVDLIDYH